MAFHGHAISSVQFTAADLQDARERTELSLLARIYWDDSRDLRLVENSFIPVWKCSRIRIFDVGYGLYQFIFPSVSKRNFVLVNQPWYFQKAIINFTDNMSPSEELYNALRFMSIWVKIIGMPFACRTVAVGRKLLSQWEKWCAWDTSMLKNWKVAMLKVGFRWICIALPWERLRSMVRMDLLLRSSSNMKEHSASAICVGSWVLLREIALTQIWFLTLWFRIRGSALLLTMMRWKLRAQTSKD
ncbi:hypothetical protein LINPERPRIM_LOCUS30404 [Linum perenne]